MAVIEGLATDAIWTGATKWLPNLLGRRIRITEPRPLETLKDPMPVGNDRIFYTVRGKLKHLPRNHRIWLLVQDDKSVRVWPQGHELVQFNRETGEWAGKVSGFQSRPITIVAVVAPPTSHDFFTYYHAMGLKTGYTPLTRVPLECTNSDLVQARVP